MKYGGSSSCQRVRIRLTDWRRQTISVRATCDVESTVWEALYRMLEDPDLGVRKAAYHTLTDGGNPDDPDLDDVFERASRNETDRKLQRRIQGFLNDRKARAREREGLEQKVAATVSDYAVKGKCDFCGEDRPVREDYDTQIPGGSGNRAGLVCEVCDG